MSEHNEAPSPNPPRKGIRRGIYIVPSAFTIGNILCGFYAIINSVKGYQSLDDPAQAAQLFNSAARAIGLAFLLDGLDGRIARMTKATSEFGVELDSIADVISFGLAPAVLAYTWGYGSTPGLDRFGWGISFFFLICGALRLARFNVMARAPRFTVAGNTPKLDKRYFVGLPIPAAAALLAALIHFNPRPLATYTPDRVQAFSLALLAMMALCGLLMVSTFRYTSFKDIGPRNKQPLVVIALFSLFALLTYVYSEYALLILAALYVAHGPLLKLWNMLSSRLRRSSISPEERAESMHIES
jgi:CDP-diacylglycerol---serine O-phosphatidyltransferase